MKDSKLGKDLSATEWLLSIAGIIFLLTVIILPPVFREVFKEKVNPDELIDELDIKTLTCSKSNYYSEGSKNDDTITIVYYKDKIRTYTLRYQKIFDDITAYDNEKQSLGLLSTAYGLVDGIELSVTPNDTDLKITSVEKCTPGTFKSTIVNLPETQQDYKVNSKYSSTDSVKQIKLDLEQEGYKCKIESN